MVDFDFLCLLTIFVLGSLFFMGLLCLVLYVIASVFVWAVNKVIDFIGGKING